jgi:hypothetical protein
MQRIAKLQGNIDEVPGTYATYIMNLFSIIKRKKMILYEAQISYPHHCEIGKTHFGKNLIPFTQSKFYLTK